MKLLSVSGVCGRPRNDSDGKLYAALGTHPLGLNDLLKYVKDAAEKQSIRCFYPQVQRAKAKYNELPHPLVPHDLPLFLCLHM